MRVCARARARVCVGGLQRRMDTYEQGSKEGESTTDATKAKKSAAAHEGEQAVMVHNAFVLLL